MDKISQLILPILLFSLFLFSAFKKIKVLDSFTEGAKESFGLVLSIFPYLVAIFIMVDLFEASGLSSFLIALLSPVFKLLGIPTELAPLILIKPFSGSGSLALLESIYQTYGVDSYLSRAASAIYGSTETIFYISAVYFATSRTKTCTRGIVVALTSSVIGSVIACFLCYFM